MILRSALGFFLLLCMRLWSRSLLTGTMSPASFMGLDRALTVGMVVAGALFVDGLIRYFYWHRYWKRRRGRDTPALIQDILTIALGLLALSIGLWWQEGLSFTGLITASGATAVILGIALQTVIQDLFSGLSVNLEGSYALGDWLTIYSEHLHEPVYGRVSGITWRATFLSLENGRRFMVPNHLVTANPVLNHSRPRDPKRISVEVSLDIRVPCEHVVDMLLGEAMKTVREPGLAPLPEPSVIIDRVAGGAISYHVRFYFDPDLITPEIAKSVMYRAALDVIQQNMLPMPVTQVEMTSAPDLDFVFGREEMIDGLHHATLFAHVLNDEQFDLLVNRCTFAEFNRGAVLMRQGEAASSMFIIVEGAARVTITAPQGLPQEVAVLASGDVVGEMSLMTGAQRTATVTALTQLRTLEITKEPIEELLQKSPELLQRFSHVLAKRQQELNELAHRTMFKSPNEIDLLARMKTFFGRVLG